MRRLSLPVLLIIFLGCSGSEGDSVSDAASPAVDSATVVSLLMGNQVRMCAGNADCVTGVCDLDSFLGVGEERGVCVNYSNAFWHWQRVLLGNRLQSAVRENPELLPEMLRQVESRWDEAVSDSERETLILLAASLGPDSIPWLEKRLNSSLSRSLRTLIGARLARLGSDSGIDLLLDAALSSVIRNRLLAMGAVVGLCDEISMGILAEGLADRHRLVRRRAAETLGQCATEKACALLDAELNRVRDDKFAEDGSLFALQKALRNCR